MTQSSRRLPPEPCLRQSQLNTGVMSLKCMPISAKTNEFYDRLHRELDRETDRSVAIIAAALVDSALQDLVQGFLIPSKKQDRCILSGYDSPLGTFSAKIDAALQFGLISADLHRDLHLLRKIRNDFAHDPFELTFESAAVSSRVRELMTNSRFDSQSKERIDTGPGGTRHDFIFSVGWRLFSLTEEMDEIERLKPRIPEFGYIDLKQYAKPKT
ncbi:MAG: DUF4145 domain-containing protein [Pseudomonadota bacterium]